MTIVMVVSIQGTMRRNIRISSVVTMFARKPIWAVLITVVAMFAAVLGGSSLASLLFPRESLFYTIFGSVAVTLAAVLIVWSLRRFVTRQPWSGLRLTWDRRALPRFLVGLAAAMAAILLANTVAVAVGVARFVTVDPGGSAYPVLILLVIFPVLLGQAFPEEVLWRGHLYDTLPPRITLVTTSLAFGAMHIVSNGGQEGVAEHLLYVLMACALGFGCGAARERTGSLWAAIGFHTGFHLAHRIAPAESIRYGVQLALLAAATTATAVIFLRAGRRASDAKGDFPRGHVDILPASVGRDKVKPR